MTLRMLVVLVSLNWPSPTTTSGIVNVTCETEGGRRRRRGLVSGWADEAGGQGEAVWMRGVTWKDKWAYCQQHPDAPQEVWL